jgi:hypothetical protein
VQRTGRPPLPQRNGHAEREPRHAERVDTPPEPPRPVELHTVAPEINHPAPTDGDTRAQAQQQPRSPGMVPGRPSLPQRRRQQNLVPQLREDTPPAWPKPSAGESEHNREETPEQARSRLAAFQAGTRRGRDEPLSGDRVNGNDSAGSARNGQHRSE